MLLTIVGCDCMKSCEKLTNRKINMITNNINKRIFISDETYHEKFKQIKIDKYYTYYLISSFGRVFSFIKYPNILELKPIVNTVTGYFMTRIYYDGTSKFISIHKLVATHFIKNPEKLPVINHIDANKSNNAIWNLEWCTQKYNVKHAQALGLWTIYGENNKNNVYTSNQIHAVCKMLTKNIPTKKISKTTGVSVPEILLIFKGSIWKEISSKYDISDYSFGKNKNDIIAKKAKIHEICKMLELNKYTMREIADIVGLPYYEVKNVYKGGRYKDISSQYNLSKFTKIKPYIHSKNYKK